MNTDLKTWSTHLPVAFVELDENLEVVDASRAALSMFRIRYRPTAKDHSVEELSAFLLGIKSFVKLIGEASFKLTRLGSQTSLRWHNGGRVFDIEMGTMPSGDHIHYGLHFQNVTKQIEFERSREVTRNYLEQMIDSLPLGIVVVDCNMCITAMNRVQQGFLEMQGAPSSLLGAVGSLLSDLLPAHDGYPWEEIAEHLFVERRSINDLQYTCTINGELRTFLVHVVPLMEEGGEVIGAMHITEEVTQMLRLQQDARESEVLAARLETLQHTVVTLNHVINNKLMGIMCSIEMVRSAGEEISEGKQTVLADVMDEVDKIASFIRDLASIKEIKLTDYLKGGEKMLDVYSE